MNAKIEVTAYIHAPGDLGINVKEIDVAMREHPSMTLDQLMLSLSPTMAPETISSALLYHLVDCYKTIKRLEGELVEYALLDGTKTDPR